LTSEEIEWFVDHWGAPEKVRGGFSALTPVHMQLIERGLVVTELFGLRDTPDIAVVTPTELGYTMVAHAAPGLAYQCAWDARVSPEFIDEHIVPYLSLGDLPELLTSPVKRVRSFALRVFDHLKGA